MLWALVLAVGVAGWDWAELQLGRNAERQRALLLPAADPTDEQRAAALERLLKEPAVAGAQWLSPREQTERLTRDYAAPAWGALFAEDSAWLPYVLEVGFTRPLDNADALNGFASRRGGEAEWALMSWDNARLAELRAERLQLRAALGTLLLLALLAGLAALRCTPLGSAGPVWRALLGAGMPGAVAAAAWLAGAPLGARTLTVALGAGFVLAALVAPMLRQVRGRQLSVSVGESGAERAAL